jgi:hypothetical protein
MATPGELRTRTLRELRAARKDMTSAIFLISLESQPEQRRKEAALKLLDTERAILALGNEELAEIRDVLLENETELLEGIAELGKARKRLSQVAKVLDAVGGVLTTVAKVAKFAATGI